MRTHRAVALPYSVRVGGPHPLNFGNAPSLLQRMAGAVPGGWSDSARLFATAYAIGFVAVSMFIA